MRFRCLQHLSWNRRVGFGVPLSSKGVKPVTQVYSLLSHYPTSYTAGFTPSCGCRNELLLRARVGAVDFGIAFMRTLLQVLAVGALLLLDSASAAAADCSCDQLSTEGCAESVSVFEAPGAPPLWCERSDDPRCMPASTHGTSVSTLVPVVMSFYQTIRWDAPPRTGVLMDVGEDGDARTGYSRRIDRPPR